MRRHLSGRVHDDGAGTFANDCADIEQRADFCADADVKPGTNNSADPDRQRGPNQRPLGRDVRHRLVHLGG